MDTMTPLSLKSLGIPKNRIIIWAALWTAPRFKYFLSRGLLGCNAKTEVVVWFIGGHGDTTMIPLARLTLHAEPAGEHTFERGKTG